jgi:glycosyltransferase involved in cell wall biosynthesis
VAKSAIMTMKKKKVLVFLPFLTRGGAETQGLLLAKGLKQNGFEVEVCGFSLKNGNETLLPSLVDSNIQHFTLPFGMDVFTSRFAQYKAFWEFRKILLMHQIDVIIPFTWWCNFLSALVFKFAGVKQCFWNQRSVDEHVNIRKIERLLPLKSLTFVSNSKPGKKFLVKRFSIPEQRVHIINNGVKVNENNSVAKKKLTLPVKDDDFVAVMLANFFPEKDALTVIRGVDTLRHRYTHFKMLFVGNAHSEYGLHAKAKAFEHNLCNQVFFIDSVEEVDQILEVAHVGILSSKSEGCPNSILEYIQHGLPVVATNIEAIADVTGENYPFLFELGNEKDFIEKICPLLESAELRSSTAKQLQEEVLPRYATSKMIDSFISLIK